MVSAGESWAVWSFCWYLKMNPAWFGLLAIIYWKLLRCLVFLLDLGRGYCVVWSVCLHLVEDTVLYVLCCCLVDDTVLLVFLLISDGGYCIFGLFVDILWKILICLVFSWYPVEDTALFGILLVSDECWWVVWSFCWFL